MTSKRWSRESHKLWTRPFTALLLGLFGAFAVTLAAVGLYGVLTYVTTQRTREIGIRMALGAEAGRVVKDIANQGMRLTVIGVLIGLAGLLSMTRIVNSLLFEVTASDPVTVAAVTMCWFWSHS